LTDGAGSVEPEVSAITTLQDLDDSVVRDVMALVVDLVASGAALGWVDPPSTDEVRALLMGVAEDVEVGDAALVLARVDGTVVGFGYWRRYQRPTHRMHADLEKLAVRADQHRRGLGRWLTTALIELARREEIEQLTLDLRADNTAAISLYGSLGFREYGRLPDFVAVGDQRYARVLCVLDLRAQA
jgi:ribosomal protein S18 acetylase RimI-like enzyme